MDIVLSTSLTILNEAKAFARSAKQAKKLRKELETEASLTESTLKNLQDFVEEIGRMDGNTSSNVTVSAGSPSDKTIQSFMKLDAISAGLRNLQEGARSVRTQLESINNRTDNEISRKRLTQILRLEKGKDEAQALLENIGSLQRSASSLFQMISTRLQAERFRREENERLVDAERRRQEAEKQELDKLERQRQEAEKLRREENARREEAERQRREAEKQEMEKSEKQRQELIDWLKPFDYNSKHQTATQSRQEGTCGWILENETFQNWRSGSGSSFLWLYGIPGSGKTILFSKVIDDLKKLSNTIVAYHYCDFMND